MKQITVEEIKKDREVQTYIKKADVCLGVMGYTEHGSRHANLVSNTAQNLLKKLNYPERESELAAIAGYLHDTGNVVNRDQHAKSGALISRDILKRIGMPIDEVVDIVSAIGSHHEDCATPVSAVTAALIIADKSDVHKTRVRDMKTIETDIHDRVNYSAEKSFVTVDPEKKEIILEITMNTEISYVMEYFEIFLERMNVARRAAKFLGCHFNIIINGNKLL